MLTTNRSYKGITFNCSDFTQYDVLGYRYLLEEESHNTALRTQTRDRASYHGGYFGVTLASSRLFTFRGRMMAKNPTDRETGMRLLIGQIQQEGNPNATNRGFYDLEWDDDKGVRRTVRARVYEAPQITKDLKKQEVNFSFVLASENETIYTKTESQETGGIGYGPGFTLPATLPLTTSSYAGSITCTNGGNYITPCKISVVGVCTNVKVLNLTNGYEYALNTNTTDLVIDNTNPSNDPTRTLVVTDSLVDISQFRERGGGIYLDPGANELVVLTDVYGESATVTITFRDGRNW